MGKGRSPPSTEELEEQDRKSQRLAAKVQQQPAKGSKRAASAAAGQTAKAANRWGRFQNKSPIRRWTQSEERVGHLLCGFLEGEASPEPDTACA